jgi:CheY-like chemotaxis protein
MNIRKPFAVLLVEDEPADAHLVKVALRENRLLVDLHVAGDGVDALEFLRRENRHGDAPRPNLILLDLNLPRMDGREFLAVVKDDPELSDIPVVVLTSSDVERDVVASYQLCAAGYITKPMDLEQFSLAIRSLGDYWFALVRLPERGT